jgi:hypothetical protein
MLASPEMLEIKQQIVHQLLQLLEEEPKFVALVEQTVTDKFPRREEFLRLVEEVKQLRKEMEWRFEQVDQRFEQVDQRFVHLTEEVRDLRDWVELIAGRLQTRAGRNLENIVAGAFRLGLQRPEIDASQVKLRQKISDPHGLVFKAGKQKEVDLIARDGELLVFEVKSALDLDDVDDFADKVELVRLQNPDKQVQGVFVAVGNEEDVRRGCAQRGLLLIP